ncbi:MAG: hypothetical protein ABSC29_01395 [Minisyncoccia bacterium]|jgi:hypothetical protein
MIAAEGEKKKVSGIEMELNGDILQWRERYADNSVGEWNTEAEINPSNAPGVKRLRERLLAERGLTERE